jgi:hypothetical protein
VPLGKKGGFVFFAPCPTLRLCAKRFCSSMIRTRDKGVKEQTISRKVAEAQRLANNGSFVSFAPSRTLRLCVKPFCSFSNSFAPSMRSAAVGNPKSKIQNPKCNGVESEIQNPKSKMT